QRTLYRSCCSVSLLLPTLPWLILERQDSMPRSGSPHRSPEVRDRENRHHLDRPDELRSAVPLVSSAVEDFDRARPSRALREAYAALHAAPASLWLQRRRFS